MLNTIDSEKLERRQPNIPVGAALRQSNLALLDQTLKESLVEQGWHIDARIPSPAGQKWREIDAICGDVGVEFHFAGYQAILSDLFVKYPIFLQAHVFRVPVIVVPASAELCGVSVQRALRRSTFENIRDAFMGIDPLPVKYPFAVLGISDIHTPLEIKELTSEMDQFLIESVGLSLERMRLVTEQPEFDFKEQLPERDFAELAAALANLRGGGVVLIGVDNQGNITGLSRGHLLDQLLLRISNIIQDTCQPRPYFESRVFDDPSNVSRCVVVVRIHEMDYKPCMVRGRVYIRVGSSTRFAGPNEVRRLVLG